MEANKASVPLHRFLTSLKEVEDILKKQSAVTEKDDIPLQWREVVHMARIAPALIDCLKGCQDSIRDFLSTIDSEEASDPSVAANEIREVMNYCSQIIQVAEHGAGPEKEAVH
jgi:hypothetical protein